MDWDEELFYAWSNLTFILIPKYYIINEKHVISCFVEDISDIVVKCII